MSAVAGRETGRLPLKHRPVRADGPSVPGSPIGASYEKVLAAARENQPWAYERLWRSLSPAVVSYLRLQGAHDAEDLTSEVFMGAFGNLRSFSGTEDQFRGWLWGPRAGERRRGFGRQLNLGSCEPFGSLSSIPGMPDLNGLPF